MNKTIVITGGSLGIGAAAARALRTLLSEGAKLVITGRSAKTAEIAQEIGCDHVLVDFGKLADVRDFAKHLLATYERIDVLANNVGGLIDERQMTEDGNEKTLQVNHLGGFLLTRLLQDRLASSKGVVINTSSAAHLFGSIDLANLQSEHGYMAFRAYANAKLMNVLHASELSRRTKGAIRAVSFHPGPVATGFAREGGPLTQLLYQTFLKDIFLISPEKGADTLVWMATTAEPLVPGGYYAKRKVATKNPQANDVSLGSALWTASESLVAPFL